MASARIGVFSSEYIIIVCLLHMIFMVLIKYSIVYGLKMDSVEQFAVKICIYCNVRHKFNHYYYCYCYCYFIIILPRECILDCHLGSCTSMSFLWEKIIHGSHFAYFFY